MRYAKIMMSVAVLAAFGTAACNRPAEETREAGTEVDQQMERQRDEAAQLEQRTDELERDWNAAQERLSKRTDAATTEAKAEIQELIADAKREVAELRSTNADNWWERTEQDIESAVGEVEQDVKRFARRWTPNVDNENIGTTGDTDTWEARRERLVNRMQARIDSMEQALRDIGPDADKEDVEETREELREMREDTNRLRTADENDWWDVTRERVNNFIQRIDARIDRLTNDNS